MRHSRQRRRRRTGLVITVAVVLVVALAAAGTWFFWLKDSVATSGTSTPVTSTVVNTRPPVVDPPVLAGPALLEPVPADSGDKPDPKKLQEKLEPFLTDSGAGWLRGEILDGATGERMWAVDADDPVPPASTLKVLLGAAVLTSMSADTRFTTKIVVGPEPGDIIVVGGGDVTLSAAQANVQSVYRGAPTVGELAAQVQASGYQVTRILVDTTYWSDDPLAPGWLESDITGTDAVARGYITRMEPLMVDGDRTDPSFGDSRRTGQPAMTAATAIARALGNPDLPIEMGAQATGDEQVLATVQSQPVSVLLAFAMQTSDNVLAEALGRQVAIARGAPPTFAGASDSVMLSLEQLGLDTIGSQIYDVSGMSTEDKVTTRLLAETLQLAVSGSVPALDNLLPGLAVAGAPGGTLAVDKGRFDQDSNAMGRGWVRAKTGSLGSVHALAGYVTTVDGRSLVFVLNSGNAGPTTRPAQDTIAAQLRLCGCS